MALLEWSSAHATGNLEITGARRLPAERAHNVPAGRAAGMSDSPTQPVAPKRVAA